MHLRQLLLTPPRNAPSSPAALAALSPMLARTALLLATLRTVVRTPQPLFSSSAIQLPARKPDPPVTRTRPRLLRGFGHRWLPPSGCVYGEISPWDHTANRRGCGTSDRCALDGRCPALAGNGKVPPLASAPLKTGKVA